MDTLSFIAVILVCATVITVAWIVAERWYAHRDRAFQVLVRSTDITAKIAIGDVVKASKRAIADTEAAAGTVVGRVDELDSQVKRLLQLEQERIREQTLGGR